MKQIAATTKSMVEIQESTDSSRKLAPRIDKAEMASKYATHLRFKALSPKPVFHLMMLISLIGCLSLFGFQKLTIRNFEIAVCNLT